MTPEVSRLLIAVGVVATAVVAAWLINRLKKPPHPVLTVQPDGDRPGVVLFTSLDCSTCKAAIGVLRDTKVPYREITHELEPQRFEAWQVLAVPLTVVLDTDGFVVDTIAGVPRSRKLMASVHAAGIQVPQ